MIHFSHVTFSYDARPAADVFCDFSFHFEKNIWHMVYGPNGSGKSTLMLLASGLLLPRTGNVKTLGTDTQDTSFSSVQKKIGIVFSNPAIHFIGATVREEITMGASCQDAFFNDTVELLGLGAYEQFPPNILSSSCKERVAIAAAVLKRPSLFIFDDCSYIKEPLRCSELEAFFRRHNIENNVIILSNNLIKYDIITNYLTLYKGQLVYG